MATWNYFQELLLVFSVTLPWIGWWLFFSRLFFSLLKKHVKNLTKIWYVSALQEYKALNSDTHKTNFLVEYVPYIDYWRIVVPYILVRRLKHRKEFYIRYWKHRVYLHHFPWIYPSIICQQTTCCILLVFISRSSLLSSNWKQGSAELQKSLWLSHKISVWCAINSCFF